MTIACIFKSTSSWIGKYCCLASTVGHREPEARRARTCPTVTSDPQAMLRLDSDLEPKLASELDLEFESAGHAVMVHHLRV